MKILVVSSKYQPEYSGSGLRAHNTYKRLLNDLKDHINGDTIISSFDENGDITKVEYSFVYKRIGDTVKIVLHHSSLPYTSN